MSTGRVPANAAALLVGRVVSALAAVGVVSLAAHRLDIEQFGLVVSVMAAGFIANTLLTFGTDTVIVRAIAAERSDAVAVMWASARWQVAAAVVLVIGALLATVAGVDVAVLVQALALLPLAAVTVAASALRGLQRMDLLLVSTLSGSFVALVAAVVFFLWKQASWVPIAAFAIGSVVAAGVAIVLVRPLLPAGEPTVSMRSLVSEAGPFAAMVILAAIGAQVGLLLVEFFSDDTAGGYGAAVRLSEAARLVPAAAMGAFFPAMLTGLHQTDRYRMWMRGLLGYAVVATLGLLALAGVANRVIFANQPGGANLIRILALGLVVTVVRLALSFELIAENRERTVLLSALAGAAVALGGGVVAARSFGAEGVAWAQLVGLVVATLVLAMRRSAAAESTPTTV